jgi:hypothetical protein
VGPGRRVRAWPERVEVLARVAGPDVAGWCVDRRLAEQAQVTPGVLATREHFDEVNIMLSRAAFVDVDPMDLWAVMKRSYELIAEALRDVKPETIEIRVQLQ